MPENADLSREGYDRDAAIAHDTTIVSDLSRIARRAQMAYADGYPLESRRGGDDGFDDFIEVDHDDASEFSFLFHRRPKLHQSPLADLHPFVQLLSLSNVDDCVDVEAAFPEHERSTREKVRSKIRSSLFVTYGNAASLVSSYGYCHACDDQWLI
jgi:hypothetical protein